MKYRNNEYFNNTDQFLFHNDFEYFVDKVHYYNGYWYTNSGLQYKATTLKCKQLDKKWQEAQSKAWDKERTYLFKKI